LNTPGSRKITARRIGALGCVALGALIFAAPAGAAESFGQAEWAQRYDSGARLTVARSTTPLLSPRTLAATEQAIEQYRAIVANGGWGMVGFGIAIAMLHVAASLFGSAVALSLALSTCVSWNLGLWWNGRRKLAR